MDNNFSLPEGFNAQYQDFIGIYDHSIPQSLAQETLDFVKMASNYNMFNDAQRFAPIPKTYRNDNDVFLPAAFMDKRLIDTSSGFPTQCLPWALLSTYKDYIDALASQYINHYGIDCKVRAYEYKIHIVKPGEGYHIFHYESQAYEARRRMFTWLTYIVATESGGETEFLYQKMRVEPLVARTVFFPAEWTHAHRGNPVLKGSKLYWTGWYEWFRTDFPTG